MTRFVVDNPSVSAQIYSPGPVGHSGVHYGKLRGIRQTLILGEKIISFVEVLCLHVKVGRDLDI